MPTSECASSSTNAATSGSEIGGIVATRKSLTQLARVLGRLTAALRAICHTKAADMRFHAD
jgi:hypothetical protein